MGLNTFTLRAKGPSIQEAYEQACQRFRHAYGHRADSGGIGTTASLDVVDADWAGSGQEADEFTDSHLGLNVVPGICYGLTLKAPRQNPNECKSTVLNTPHKGRKAWQQFYRPYPLLADGLAGTDYNTCLGTFEKKEDAVAAARAYAEQHRCSVQVDVVHLLGKDQQSALVSYKPSPLERDGEFLFFGWAETDTAAAQQARRALQPLSAGVPVLP
jgi:hypothetical protein